MGITLEREINDLLDESERNRACAFATCTGLRKAFASRVKAGVLISPREGLFARAECWRDLRRREKELRVLRTLALRHPNWTFCHGSAALVHGLAVSLPFIRQAHVATKPSDRRSQWGQVAYHVIDPLEVRTIEGMRVTTLERTCCDCMLTQGFRHGLAIADSYLRKTGCTREDLVRLLRQTCRRRRGLGQALETAGMADPLAESGGESIARAAMLDFGYELPELQAPVGTTRYRADFCWQQADGQHIYAELDGQDKYVDPELTGGRSTLEVLSDERIRESRITLERAPILRFRYKTIWDDEAFCTLLDTFGVPRAREPLVRLALRKGPDTRTGHDGGSDRVGAERNGDAPGVG